MTWELGCDVCREGIYVGGQPRLVVATMTGGPLYRCDACRTWWLSDLRTAHPVTDLEARERFPEVVPEPRA